MSDSDVVPTVASAGAQLYDLNALAEYRAERRVRKKLFRTGQLWSEVLYYEPGQSTPMHQHPYEEEQFVILAGRAAMSVGGEKMVLEAGALLRVEAAVPHDVRNIGTGRLVIVFTKVPTALARTQRQAAASAAD